jgi:hypothetical protein
MTRLEVHELLQGDAAYVWSVDHNDAINMQLVLRAHKLNHTFKHAEVMIHFADVMRTLENQFNQKKAAITAI